MRRLRTEAIAAILLLAPACAGGTSATEPAPDPEGVYTAEIPLRDFGDVPGPSPRSLAGTWTLTLEDDGDSSSYRLEAMDFGRVSGSFSHDAESAVFDDEPAPSGAFNCYIGGARTTTEGRASYEMALTDTEMTLQVIEEPCPLRGAILERTWEGSSG